MKHFQITPLLTRAFALRAHLHNEKHNAAFRLFNGFVEGYPKLIMDLRRWIIENLAGKRVLNTFAYTGSLGVAAKKAGADKVQHVDRNRDFLNVAKESYTLNGFALLTQRKPFLDW